MGKATGFIEFDRVTSEAIKSSERIKNFKEFHTPLAINMQKKQGGRCMDCGVPFCQSGMILGGMTTGCPLNNLIPEWNDAIYNGNYKEALERLLKTNNFPEFTGRVCPAPCEVACTSNIITSPVSIKENELSIIEHGFENGHMTVDIPKVRTGKKIAVIGSGPSGLAAADSLNKRGHQVTVYERSDRFGGLLMYGIPNMKLEKEIVDRRVKLMREEGVEFLPNMNVGVNISASEIMSNYDCVILACGASKARDLHVSGREAKGVYYALEYLTSVTKSLLDSNLTDKKAIDAKNKKVLVVGGGDTGNDCIGTAIRQGAKSVVQIEMMPRLPLQRTEDNPWPQWPKTLKVDYGQEESIEVYGKDPRAYELTVKEFISDKKGNLSKVKLVKVKRNYNKELKRMELEEEVGSEYDIAIDLAFIAAGFTGCEDYITKEFGVVVNERNNVKTQERSYASNVEKVYTTGDMHRGQSLVVWAIREGREVAREVDEKLMGYSNI